MSNLTKTRECLVQMEDGKVEDGKVVNRGEPGEKLLINIKSVLYLVPPSAVLALDL